MRRSEQGKIDLMKFVKFDADEFGSSEPPLAEDVAHCPLLQSAEGGSAFRLSKLLVSSCALILFGTGASVAEDGGEASQPEVQELAVKPPVVPVVADPAATAAALDKRYGVHGWNNPFPSFADTLLQDFGGWRSELANYGIGFLDYNITLSATNVLNTPTTNNGTQAYWGQRPSVANANNPWLTYDLSQFGIPDGQIQLAAFFITSSWQPYLADETKLGRLSYYQTFLDKKLEMNIGFLENSTNFIGVNVGGQLQSPFGPDAAIPTELGIASFLVQPTAWFKYNITDNWYDTFAVMRSVSPTANVLVDDEAKNPTGFDFRERGANALYLNELGYRNAPSSDRLMTWVRGGAVYNSSLYQDYATGRMHTNSGFYLLADQQVLQVVPGWAPGRGLYVGGTVMYTPPETSIFSQYYEARVYGLGLLDARPQDFVSLVYYRNEISKFAANQVNMTAALTGTFAQYETNSLVASYTLKVVPGIYLTAGVGYTDHPSFTFIPKEGSALTLLAGAYVAL
jgi:porin